MARGGREALVEQFDPEFGGFNFDPARPKRPKFPEPANLLYLLDQHRRDKSGTTPDPPAPANLGPLAMALRTFDAMARGGIRDHLAGGYHRYSTVRDWSVPHFEKMLYDNAQIAEALVIAFEATGDARWKAEAEAIFAFVARTMTAPDGLFYSAALDTPRARGRRASRTSGPARRSRKSSAPARSSPPSPTPTASTRSPTLRASATSSSSRRPSPTGPSKPGWPPPDRSSWPSATAGPRRCSTTRSSPPGMP